MSASAQVRWLRAAALITVATGLVAAAASSPSGERPWRLLLDLLAWPIDGEPDRFDPVTSAVNAVTGGVMVGWGTLMYLIARGPFARGDTALATPVLLSVLAWFVVDSMGSFAAGLPGNVVLNVGFLLLLAPPLHRMRRDRTRDGAPHRRASGTVAA
jgi:hypothetical protein